MQQVGRQANEDAGMQRYGGGCFGHYAKAGIVIAALWAMEGETRRPSGPCLLGMVVALVVIERGGEQEWRRAHSVDDDRGGPLPAQTPTHASRSLTTHTQRECSASTFLVHSLHLPWSPSSPPPSPPSSPCPSRAAAVAMDHPPALSGTSSAACHCQMAVSNSMLAQHIACHRRWTPRITITLPTHQTALALARPVSFT